MKKFKEKDIVFPKRVPQSHKGNYGKLGIVAGSQGLTGAAILSARAALACGAGLITLYHPIGLEQIFETTLIEVMTKPYHPSDEQMLAHICQNDALLIGPGMSTSAQALQVLTIVLSSFDKPLVIDADALNLLSENRHLLDILKGRPVILTPHIVEFSRLSGISVDDIQRHTEAHLNKFCQRYKVTVLLKSHYCLCANENEMYCIEGGNDGLSKGGTGDVLAGMIASFLVQSFCSSKSPQSLQSIINKNSVFSVGSVRVNKNEEIATTFFLSTVSSATKYLYQIAENLERTYHTPAITPSKIIENIFKKEG